MLNIRNPGDVLDTGPVSNVWQIVYGHLSVYILIYSLFDNYQLSKVDNNDNLISF